VTVSVRRAGVKGTHGGPAWRCDLGLPYLPGAGGTGPGRRMSEPRPRRTACAVQVLRTERLSASLTRVVLGGPGLAGFDPPCADSYVKVVFVHPDVPRPLPRSEDGRVDLDAVRETLAPEHAPRMRSYTVRAFDPAALELTLDFVVHGDAGLAGPWAASAQVGDELLFLGPGGAYSPDPAAERHLFVGDLSALPAIAVSLERLPADAVGDVVVEVHGPEDEIVLAAPAGVRVAWVHQGDERPGARLLEAVRALPWTDGDVQAFVHGEAGSVKELRRYLRTERGMGLDRLSISGYWRLGVDDEGWRAAKREWNAEIEQAEAAVGV
jgi:NADPH-dependent ferric siderophore reductase